ncbi:hypothetical protein BU14_3128s0001 [Porphyra umbilicalis]|uniref:Uncharacterized protein n=1 Tax=Porphyra umbilicalis TaxID=2786 RepID=A0A1X6NI12_PORUM|nr:hypothetical protein BU14_3128s0001 [Porphyra umbilicalis]|eukprot:OSX68258.1 hypothetical protein BU14_3128s0001 [Porphyra umbilicalis]
MKHVHGAPADKRRRRPLARDEGGLGVALGGVEGGEPPVQVHKRPHFEEAVALQAHPEGPHPALSVHGARRVPVRPRRGRRRAHCPRRPHVAAVIRRRRGAVHIVRGARRRVHQLRGADATAAAGRDDWQGRAGGRRRPPEEADNLPAPAPAPRRRVNAEGDDQRVDVVGARGRRGEGRIAAAEVEDVEEGSDRRGGRRHAGGR